MKTLNFTGELRESKEGDQGFLWEVSVIGEGPGLNSQRGNDGKLYRENFTRESISELVPKLNGVKVKAYRFQEGGEKESRNHLPAELDNYYANKTTGNNVGVLEKPSEAEVNGKVHAFATLRLGRHDQAMWLRDMLLWAHESGHPDYLGLSINSTGLTKQRVVEGTGERYLDVLKINRPKSVEVVDSPAASGQVRAQFVRLIQSYHDSENVITSDEVISDDSADTSVDIDVTEGSEDTDDMANKVQESTIISGKVVSETEEVVEDVNESSQETEEKKEEPEDEKESSEPTQEITESHEESEQDEGEPDQEQQEKKEDDVVSDDLEKEESQETESQENVMELQITESFKRYVQQPLMTYLDQRGVIYTGEDVKEIVESLDVSGMSPLDQAAIGQLRTYVNNNQINAAKSLTDDLILSLSRADSALQHLHEYKAISNLKQSQPETQEEEKAGFAQEEILKENTENQDDHTPLQDTNINESSNESDDIETMSKKLQNQDTGQDEKTRVEEKVEVTEKQDLVEGENKKEDAPEEKPEVKEKPAEDKVADSKVSSLEDSISKLVQSISSFTSQQASETDELKKEVAELREQRSESKKTQEAAEKLQSVLDELNRREDRARMDRILESSGLLPEVQDKLRKQIGDKVLSTEQLNSLIEDEQVMLAKIEEASIGTKLGNVYRNGFTSLRMGANVTDKFQVAMHRLFENSDVDMKLDDKNPAWEDPGCSFSSLRQGYSLITGDLNVDGVMNDRYIREGVIGHDTFEKTLSNTMNRYLVQWYDTFDHSWRQIVRIRRGIRDFKQQEMNRIGGFGNLQVFSDTMANPSPTGYLEATPPIEQAGSFRPRIRAKIFTITEEMIKNDDLFVITRMLEESARAADETLMTFAFGLLVGGATYLENNKVEFVPASQLNTDDIYSGSHLRKVYGGDNSGTSALGYDSLLLAINQMKRMRKIGNNKPLRLYNKKYLVVPLQIENTAQVIHPSNTDRAPGSSDWDANILPKDLTIIPVDSMYLGDDPNNWYLIEDPMRWEGIQIGFVDDEENPRIVLANNPTAGRTFTHGGLQYTVSHRYGGGIASHEGLYGSFPVNP